MSKREQMGVRMSVAAVFAIAALTVGLLSSGCGEAAAPTDPAAALEFAPPNAFGIIHISPDRLMSPIIAEMKKQGAELDDVPLDLIEELGGRVSSIEIFLVPASGFIPVGAVGVVRGQITPAELVQLGEASGEMHEDVELTNLGNGRYTMPEEEGFDDDDFEFEGDFEFENGSEPLLIYGEEADDVPAGVMLFGTQDLLTDEYVRNLGTGDHAQLRAAMEDVRGAAGLWIVVSAEAVALPIPVKSASGWLDLSGDGDGLLTITFNDAESAGEMIQAVEYEDIEAVDEHISIERTANVVTIKPKGGDLAAQIVSEMISAQEKARQMHRLQRFHYMGHGFRTYANMHDDALPPDLAALAELIWDTDLSEQLEQDTHNLVYRKPGERLGQLDPDTVLVHESLEDSPDTVGVLFAGGEARMMPAAELRELLQ